MTKKDGTLLTHAGSDPAAHHGAVNVPPYRMSTMVFSSYEEFEGAAENPFRYGRVGTPTVAAFEDAVAALEGAYRSAATPSGLAAIVTVLVAFTRTGDHVLMPDNCYDPGRKSAEHILQNYGVEVEFYPALMGPEIVQKFRPNTRLLMMEAPGSLTFEVSDIGAMAAAAQRAGITTAMDNSWATPLFLKPLDLGIDVSVMSGTKYIAGHSDAMLGVISTHEDIFPAIRSTVRALGLCPGSEEAYLGLRGLRTLHLRMEEHQKSGLEMARWLEKHPAVKRVLHPALPSCPGHANWKRYFGGAAGTFGVVLKENRREKIAAMLDHMALFRMGFSWGGFESLIFPEQPHLLRSAEEWTETGFSLRLHVGLEDVEDLKADMEAGLERLK